METTKKRANFFSTPLFLLVIITLTMFNNLEHGAELYYKITKPIYPTSWLPYIHWQAYFVIIVIDLAVIGFIVNGKTADSKAFAWLLFIINCIFWDVLTEISATHYSDVSRISLLIAKIFFSAAFSYLIHKVSSLYFEKINGYSSMEQAKAELTSLKAFVSSLQAENKHLKAQEESCKALTDSEFQLKEKLKQIDSELHCPYCKNYTAPFDGSILSAIKALNAHKGVCKTKNHE